MRFKSHKSIDIMDQYDSFDSNNKLTTPILNKQLFSRASFKSFSFKSKLNKLRSLTQDENNLIKSNLIMDIESSENDNSITINVCDHVKKEYKDLQIKKEKLVHN